MVRKTGRRRRGSGEMGQTENETAGGLMGKLVLLQLEGPDSRESDALFWERRETGGRKIREGGLRRFVTMPKSERGAKTSLKKDL